MVTVVALRDFALDGRAVYAGQAVDLEPIQAAVRARNGEVSLDPQCRPTYQTRDMVAAAPVVAVAQIAPVADAKPTRRRRRTRTEPAS